MKTRTIAVALNSSWNVVNFRAGLIRGLMRAGYKVVALTPTDSHSCRLAELGVQHIPLEFDARGMSPLGDLTLLWRYWRLLGRVRPEVLLAYTIKPNIYGSIAARLRGIPVISNVAGLGDTFIGEGWVNRLVRLLYRVSLRWPKVVFFQNPDDRDLFLGRRIISPKSARLLPGSGIDLTRFAPRPAPSAGRPGEFTFLLIARMLWAKGVGDFVEAARIVRKQAPHARFQLLGLSQEGKGSIDRATIDSWVGEGVVEFLGGSDDVRPFIADSDCIVLPTYYPEGTPRALLEAAAMAKPIIASNVPGCREVVVDGVNGYLAPPRDPHALADRMLHLLGLPKEELAAFGAASRARAEHQFDERLVIAEYLSALGTVETSSSIR